MVPRSDTRFDTVIRNGRWFDGTGAPSAIRDIGIKDGHVAAVSADDLDETNCPNVIDASGKWVLPGLVDIHTHYDIEVLAAPALSESVRHGVTTVLLGSCSPVGRTRRRHRCRGHLRQGGGDTARPRDSGRRPAQDLDECRSIRRRIGIVAAGAECCCFPWAFGYARRRDGIGSRDPKR